MASYKDIFSTFYDALTADVDRGRIADFCEEMLQKYHPKRELILDLCCGTGTLAAEFSRRGYEVIGVDASPDMLMQAAEKNSGLPQPVLYLCQPLQQLDLYGTVDLAVCTLDSLNHLPGKAALKKALHRLQYFVEPGGLFIFDVNTPYKHREILGNNAFVRENEVVFCVWQNEYTPLEHKVEIQIDFFRHTAGDGYLRDGEQFCEYAWEPEEITALLEQEHFEVLELWDGYRKHKPSGETQRLVFVSRRQGK